MTRHHQRVAPGHHPVALWVVPVSGLGGVARHVLDVARIGIPGWRLFILAPPGALADALRSAGAAVITGDLGPDAGLVTSVRTLSSTIRRLRPDVVHTHLAYADVVAAFTVPGAGPTLISTEHGIAPDDSLYHANPAQQRLMRLVHQGRISRFARVIAVCESTSQVLQEKWRVPRAKIQVIRNGVDPVAPAILRNGRLHIVSLARLSPEKRLDALVESFAMVLAQRPDAHLTLAGDGPQREALTDLIERLGLGNDVSVPGHVPAADLLAEADVVVQLSAWENCSYTLLDAARYGLGVVATRVGGNPEILPPHCLVEVTANPETVSRHILEQAEPERRPALPADWPTVASMTRHLAKAYQGARA